MLWSSCHFLFLVLGLFMEATQTKTQVPEDILRGIISAGLGRLAAFFFVTKLKCRFSVPFLCQSTVSGYAQIEESLVFPMIFQQGHATQIAHVAPAYAENPL